MPKTGVKLVHVCMHTRVRACVCTRRQMLNRMAGFKLFLTDFMFILG